MNEKLQTIIEETKEKLGLEQYTLANHSIFRDKNSIAKPSYLLSMEWLSGETEPSNDEDLLAVGNVTVEIGLHTNRLQRLSIKGEVNQTLPRSSSTENIIEWIEQQTELTYGRQFKLTTEEDDQLIFHAAVDNIRVFPSGTIHVRFNAEGQLALFSIDGYFPSEEEIHWEPFALTSEITDQAGKDQCEIVEVPVDDIEKWIPVYHIPSHFITNDGGEIFSVKEAERPAGHVALNQQLNWNKVINKQFEKQDIDLSLEVSAEQALRNEEHPDQPLTNEEIEQATEATKTFMQITFPDDSDKWKLTALWPEHGLIFAEITPIEPDRRLINRKIKLMIDRDTFETKDYINNDTLLEQIDYLKQADDPAITIETAFQKLENYLEVTPVYVYFREEKTFYLCGKIDCAYVVDAINGEVILLKEK